MSGIANYDKKNTVGKFFAGGKGYVAVYNNTGSTIANGALRNLSELFISGKGVVMVPLTPATNVELTNLIGICANNTGGGIADGEIGFFQVEGPYGSLAEGFGATTSGTIHADDQLEVLTATTALIDSGGAEGAIIKGESCACAIEEVTTNVWAVYLYGKRSAIAGS